MSVHRYSPNDKYEGAVNAKFCRAAVSSLGGFRFHQCTRKPLPGGEYCSTHDPAREERKQAAWKVLFDAETALHEAVANYRDAVDAFIANCLKHMRGEMNAKLLDAVHAMKQHLEQAQDTYARAKDTYDVVKRQR